MIEDAAVRLRAWQYRVFSSLWICYAAFYFCRVNFAVAQPKILADFPTWTSAQIGTIPSVYAACYALGQVLNGPFSQRIGARTVMTASLLLAAALNLGFSMTSSYSLMLVLWGLNGYVQSTGWSLVAATVGNWSPAGRRGTIMGLVSTCYQVGNVVAWIMSGQLIELWGWRAAFYVPSALVVPVAAIFFWGVRNEPQDVGLPAQREELIDTGDGSAPAEKLSALETLKLTLNNRVLWTLGVGFFCANAVRYAFMNWAVQYLADFHGRSVKNSAVTAVVLPLIGSLGAISAGWASDTLFDKRRAPVCAIMLACLALVCMAFVQVPQGEWVWATVLLAAAGYFIYGPDMLMSGAATVDFSHPRAAAAATSFTMALGALGAIFSGWGVGALRDSAGGQWSLVFYTLAGLALVPAALMLTLWNAKPKGK